MRNTLVLVAAFVAVWVAGCGPSLPEIYTHEVTLRPQETGLWCWAASGEMVMDFHGADVSQAQQANERLGRNDCGQAPIPDSCVQSGWPEFDRYGFSFKKTSESALSWNALREEICSGRPFAFTWRWKRGGGHMMVAIGYTNVDGKRLVEVIDPWPPNVGARSFQLYEVYESGPDHDHWDDYYEVSKR